MYRSACGRCGSTLGMPREESNARLPLSRNGQSGLSVLHLPTQIGYDADDPMRWARSASWREHLQPPYMAQLFEAFRSIK